MLKTHRWFLLNKVFGLLPREIAKMEDAILKTVCTRIKDVSDKVMTGRLTFMNPTEFKIYQKNFKNLDKTTLCDIISIVFVKNSKIYGILFIFYRYNSLKRIS
jgi:hypothetical protein